MHTPSKIECFGSVVVAAVGIVVVVVIVSISRIFYYKKLGSKRNMWLQVLDKESLAIAPLPPCPLKPLIAVP